MGFLTTLLQPRVGAYAPPSVNDESAWTSWGSLLARSATGVLVGPERALQTSAVWSCARLVAESIATMPIIMYRRLADGGKERASNHPLYGVLHDAPNDLMTAFAFKRVMMVHALLYGNGYALIESGDRGPVDHLTLQHPDNVRVEAIPGGICYQVKDAQGKEHPVNAEDMLHLPGLSLDGVSGLSLVGYARESIGLALAAESYSARFYSQDARPSGFLKTQKKLTPDSARNLRDSFQVEHAGLGNAHKVGVLEEGVDWVETGMSNQDAELIAQLDWSAADIARFFNVPLHMIQLMTKTTSWGSGIEEMGIEFVTFTLLPWIRNWEQLIQARLVLAPQAYFAEFLVDSLMRGKLNDRYAAYAIGINNSWLNPNDVRRLENMNPIPNGDEYRGPLNMAPLGSEPEPSPAAAASASDNGHYALLLREAAGRVVRKEIAAMGKAAKRLEGDQTAFAVAATTFYAEHAAFVAQVMHISPDDAADYCEMQCTEITRGGIEAMADWETRALDVLVSIVTGVKE